MKYTAEEARKKPIFKLLWAMYEDIQSQDVNRRDATGTIIGWYTSIIEERLAPPKHNGERMNT